MKRFQLNNRGAALISVLVVTLFVSIIAATLLYTTAMNFQQKQTDYYNKKSFYETEKALDELKSVLVKDVQKAYVIAYGKTANEFLVQDSKRDAYYRQEFMNAMGAIWKKRVGDSGDSALAAVQDVMGGAYDFYKVEGIGVYQTETGPEDAKVKQQKFALKGVQVKYTYKNYTTFLYTDICIEPPEVVWAESYSDATEPSEVSREKIAFTDYVSYVNWRKADYESSENDEYKVIDIGDNIGFSASKPAPTTP